MGPRNNSADLSLLVSRNAANTAFRDALRLFIGRGRRYSVKQLAIGTGISERMIESFMAPVDNREFRKPDLEEVLTLALFLRSPFTAELIAIAQQGAFDLPDGTEPPPGELAADNAEDNAEIARAARDGNFDQEERRNLRPVGLRMIERGQRLVGLDRTAA